MSETAKHAGEHTPEQRQKNIEKYGDSDDDVIARAYRESKDIGDAWCLKNAEKYMRRYLSKSEKGGNVIDLKKAYDYLGRAITHNADGEKPEVVEK